MITRDTPAARRTTATDWCWKAAPRPTGAGQTLSTFGERYGDGCVRLSRPGRYDSRAMSDGRDEQSPGGEIVVYGAADGAVRVDVRLDRDTVWLTQRQMAEVFDTTPENVLMHLRNVFSSKELDAEATTKDFLVVRSEGGRRVRRRIRHYDLDAIHLRGLPGQLEAGCALSPVGHMYPARTSGPRLHVARAAACRARPARGT